MEYFSTPTPALPVNKKILVSSGPKASTLDFLCTFARMYTPGKNGQMN